MMNNKEFPKFDLKDKFGYINFINNYNTNSIFHKVDVYDIAVYQLLLCFVNKDTGYSFLSQTEMQNKLSISRSKLNESLKHLEELNFIVRDNGYKGRNTRYYFTHYSEIL